MLEVAGQKASAGIVSGDSTIDYGGKTETGGAIAFEVH